MRISYIFVAICNNLDLGLRCVYGRLGHGDQRGRAVPVRVTDGLPGGEAGVVREVSCGTTHTVVAMASGEVCTFGTGQLGHGDSLPQLAPKVVPELSV